MSQRRMCPSCRAFVSADDRVCPYCGSPIGSRTVRPSDSGDSVLGGLIPAARFTTFMILAINFALYVATAVIASKLTDGGFVTDIPLQVLYAFGGKERGAIFQDHEWWRLVTAGFLHGGLLHIAMNSWVLFDLGATVEELMGTARLLVIYFVGTVAGFLASCFWTDALSIGSSAGIFGLIGGMIAFGTRDGTSYGRALRSVFLRWAVYSLLIGVLLIAFFPVDNAAHIGGLAGGFAVGYFAADNRARTAGWSDKLWKTLAGICLALTAISFAVMFLHLNGLSVKF